MRQPDPLRLMLDGFAVHNSRFEYLHNTPMNGVALNKRFGQNKPSHAGAMKKPNGRHMPLRVMTRERHTKSSTVHREARRTTGDE